MTDTSSLELSLNEKERIILQGNTHHISILSNSRRRHTWTTRFLACPVSFLRRH
jgi:hypothetical protein